MLVEGTTKHYGQKLFRFRNHVYAGAGTWCDVILIAEWVRHGMERERLPTLHGNGPYGIIIDRKRLRAYVADGQGLALIPVHAPYAAGSGAEVARTAMVLGKTATQAVAIAAKADVYTGGRVQSWRKGT